jgi:hypothetical protein
MLNALNELSLIEAYVFMLFPFVAMLRCLSLFPSTMIMSIYADGDDERTNEP